MIAFVDKYIAGAKDRGKGGGEKVAVKCEFASRDIRAAAQAAVKEYVPVEDRAMTSVQQAAQSRQNMVMEKIARCLLSGELDESLLSSFVMFPPHMQARRKQLREEGKGDALSITEESAGKEGSESDAERVKEVLKRRAAEGDLEQLAKDKKALKTQLKEMNKKLKEKEKDSAARAEEVAVLNTTITAATAGVTEIEKREKDLRALVRSEASLAAPACPW